MDMILEVFNCEIFEFFHFVIISFFPFSCCKVIDYFLLHQILIHIFEKMTKKELALKYWDGPLPNDIRSVTNRLMRWIAKKEGVLDELRSYGYNKHAHCFTPKQVEIIYKYLGEP